MMQLLMKEKTPASATYIQEYICGICCKKYTVIKFKKKKYCIKKFRKM